MSILETVQMVIVVIVALILVDTAGDIIEEFYHKKGELVRA